MFSLEKGTFLCMNAKVSACFFAYVLKLDMPGSSLRPSECVNKNQKFKHDSSSALISEIIIQFEHRTSSERRWTCTDETSSCKAALRCESLNIFQCLPCSVHGQVAGFYADSGSAPPLLEEPPVSTFHYIPFLKDRCLCLVWMTTFQCSSHKQVDASFRNLHLSLQKDTHIATTFANKVTHTLTEYDYVLRTTATRLQSAADLIVLHIAKQL